MIQILFNYRESKNIDTKPINYHLSTINYKYYGKYSKPGIFI